jgi:hypothetical protein
MKSTTQLIVGLFAAAAAWASPSEPWGPGPPPSGCTEYSAELDLVDVSQSMLVGGRLAAAKAGLSARIDAAPPCTYIAIATFGLTSDIVAAGYTDSAEQRARLKQAVGALRAIAHYTNLDEGAKTAELFVLQLGAQQLTPHPIVIVAYTDDVSAPSPGKPVLSLAASLASRMQALHLQVADDFSGWPPAPPGARRIRVSELRAALSSDQAPDKSKPAPWLGVAAWGAAALFGIVAVVYVARRAKPIAPARVFVPGALVVSEFEEDDRGSLTVLSDSMGRAKRDRRILLYDLNTPIGFSADARAGAYVLELGGGVPATGVLFSVTPAGGFELLIEGDGITVDGRSAPKEGLTVNARDGTTVKYGQRVHQLGVEADDLHND